jgi:hypothetical protein
VIDHPPKDSVEDPVFVSVNISVWLGWPLDRSSLKTSTELFGTSTENRQRDSRISATIDAARLSRSEA